MKHHRRYSRRAESGFLAMWGAPMAIAAVITAGLACALLYEGPVARACVCIALAVPIGVVLYYLARTLRRQPPA